MALVFADQVRGVVFTLIAEVFVNHKQHGNNHKETEGHHGGGSAHAEMNQERINAQHNENGQVFVEVLNSDRFACAHEHIASVL